MRHAMTSAALKVDTVVIGAGVVGLAVARALSRRLVLKTVRPNGTGKEEAVEQAEILLVDRAASIGSETSSRNSEVIHAGLYYPPNSKKSRFCVNGKTFLYQYCKERNIAHKQCGKLIVATESSHLPTLEALQVQAVQNNVSDTQMLTRDEVRAREPSLAPTIHGALWSPSTGIIDSHALMLNFLADAENEMSTTLALKTTVTNAKLDDGRIQLHFDDNTWISCRNVINCAGLWAGHVASLLHSQAGTSSDSAWVPPRQYFCRGTYVRPASTAEAPSFSHLIYPVPDPQGGLGVHATIDLAGHTKFGPDVEWLPVDLDVTVPQAINYTPETKRVDSFYESIRSYWPELLDNSLVVDYTGVRPKLSHPNLSNSNRKSMPFEDFRIVGPETHKVPGLVHLFGIESPGLTSSIAIADYVAGIARESEQQ